MLLKNRYCPVTGDYLEDDIVLMTNHCAYCRVMENRRRIHRLCIYTLVGHKYDVKDMCFSAGGHLLATDLEVAFVISEEQKIFDALSRSVELLQGNTALISQYYYGCLFHELLSFQLPDRRPPVEVYFFYF
ncbi:hypothetical protein Tco_0548388 [Tanacetum coccineum]